MSDIYVDVIPMEETAQDYREQIEAILNNIDYIPSLMAIHEVALNHLLNASGRKWI
ncbi:MAG: hypothetical protein K0S76_730 [Herbinix sp.]|jgi:hypothetical protein|nr:hypothetical protein [Herbinix sp.]